jgi:hypothetical protein
MLDPNRCHSRRCHLSLVVITEVVAPDQQIMPEPQEQCEEPLVVPPMKMGSLDALVVPMTSSPPLVECCHPSVSVDVWMESLTHP